MVRIELLCVGQCLEVGFDCEWDDGGRAVGQVLLESLCFDVSAHDAVYLKASVC